MNTQQAYDIWSEIYDTNINKTRDLEAIAIREVLSDDNDCSGPPRILTLLLRKT
jgi:hypothetical protein